MIRGYPSASLCRSNPWPTRNGRVGASACAALALTAALRELPCTEGQMRRNAQRRALLCYFIIHKLMQEFCLVKTRDSILCSKRGCVRMPGWPRIIPTAGSAAWASRETQHIRHRHGVATPHTGLACLNGLAHVSMFPSFTRECRFCDMNVYKASGSTQQNLAVASSPGI